MERTERLPIAISAGDPRGVGPEIILRAAALCPELPLLVVGSARDFPARAVRRVDSPDGARAPGLHLLDTPAETGVDPSFAWVEKATVLARSGRVRALVTAPVTKADWLATGVPWAGHTPYLAHACRARRHAMFFHSAALKVVLFTIHQPLTQVGPVIRRPAIVSFLRFVDSELKRLFRRPFAFAVCGFNPHAGEGGAMGREERAEIEPAIRRLRRELPVSGPFPADTLFLRARGDAGTVVLAWYHDQGLIPFKLLNGFSGVNLTLGLPIVRTSPDHGPARDLAGTNRADPTSMADAIRLADELSAPGR